MISEILVGDISPGFSHYSLFLALAAKLIHNQKSPLSNGHRTSVVEDVPPSVQVVLVLEQYAPIAH